MERTSEELARDAWASYFTDLSRAHPHVEISIEIMGGDAGRGIEAAALELEDAVYDERNDVFEVAGSRRVGGGSRQVLRHFVDRPQRIWVHDGTGLPSAIEVDDHEGVRTLVRMSSP